MAETGKPVLERFEFQSAVWLKLKKHLEARIDLLRKRNDRHHDERKTAQLRGSLAELKYICGLDAETPGQPPEGDFKD